MPVVGGSFQEGKIIIEKLRALASYFGHTQRADRLAQIKNEFALPKVNAHCDAQTRVGFASILLGASILNYYAVKMY